MGYRRYSRLILEAACFVAWLLVWQYVFGFSVNNSLTGAIAGLLVIRIAFNWYYVSR